MWNSGDSITNSVDTIDSRNVIARIAELEAEREEYAKALAEAQDALYESWPANCIDWEKAADQLKSDYSCIEFDGQDYWV